MSEGRKRRGMRSVGSCSASACVERDVIVEDVEVEEAMLSVSLIVSVSESVSES
jgi:hypothetical protein